VLGLGPWELIVVAGVIVFIFGAKRLPQLGEGLGKSITEFKKAIRDEPSSDSKLEHGRGDIGATAEKPKNQGVKGSS